MKTVFEMKSDLSNLSQTVISVEETLKSIGAKSKDIKKAVLLTEEMLVLLGRNAAEGKNVNVTVSKILGGRTIDIASAGTELKEADISRTELDLSMAYLPADAENVIRNMILLANKDMLSFSYKNGINRIHINVGEGAKKNLIYSLGAIGAAVVIGMILRLLVPQDINNAMNEYVFSVVKSVFLNAFNMIMAPLIFFSIAACISSFKDLKELGKIGGKIMTFYLCTTVMAILMGFLMFNVISPGNPGDFDFLQVKSSTVSDMDFSFRDTLINIVPPNLLSAFLDSNTLQLIFLAILVGTAAGRLGNRSEAVSAFLYDANELFLKVASMITRFLPLMIFSSVISMVLTMDADNAKSMLKLVATVIAADIGMLLFYILISIIIGKTKPSFFLKNAFPAWINAFALSSSSASMAYTMDVCDKRLGISPKIYSFSIPLGATVNMDGMTVMLSITTLFFARGFGIELSGADIISLIFTIIVLSVGAPGMPGSGLICMSVLFKQFGIPIEALSLVIGIYSMLDPLSTANNVMGDVTGTYVVAKKSGMVSKV